MGKKGPIYANRWKVDFGGKHAIKYTNIKL